ncbi:MAG: hypothetical protein E6J90_41375 [Deltaproteobacteria bacterium]|nr:MAG: hypothetical protein E6J90_41375 [Deltaproteobacteria bacterium]
MSGAAADPRGADAPPAVLHAVRRTARALLEDSPGWSDASPQLRRDVAHGLVSVGMMAADLAAADSRLTPTPVLVEAQEFAATRAAGAAITDIKRALDFPEYVTSLITGVFQAITKSNLAQIAALSDLLDNVAKTQDEFTSDNIRDEDVVVWAVGKLPFLTSSDGASLAVRPGTDLLAQQPAIRAATGATESELGSLDESSLMDTLGPLVKRKIGRERQQILGTLVQMGLQRIVVDEGRLHASMDMRVDTRSASDTDKLRADQFSLETGASGSFGVGAWGASAHVNVGYNKVSTDHDVTKDEIATRAGLRSSVDLAFRTEQVPLDRMASASARVKLDNNSRVPASVSDANTSLLGPTTAAGPVTIPTTLTPSQPATSPAPRPATPLPAAAPPASPPPAASPAPAGAKSAPAAAAKPAPTPGANPASGTTPAKP